jgi:hypothetical protein
MPPDEPGAQPGITIDIPGVDESTRVGDLSVEQLVLIIHSVVRQTPVRPRALDANELAEASAQIADLLESNTERDQSAIQVGIRNMHDAILQQMPHISREIGESAARRRASRDLGEDVT